MRLTRDGLTDTEERGRALRESRAARDRRTRSPLCTHTRTHTHSRTHLSRALLFLAEPGAPEPQRARLLSIETKRVPARGTICQGTSRVPRPFWTTRLDRGSSRRSSSLAHACPKVRGLSQRSLRTRASRSPCTTRTAHSVGVYE